MKVRVEFDQASADRMLRSFSALGEAGLLAGQRVFAEAAANIVREARMLVPDDPETPFRLGSTIRALKARITKGRGGAKRVEVTVLAGGAPLKKFMRKGGTPAWAIVQHEDLTIRHTKGQAKFLEKPVNKHVESLVSVLEEEFDREFAKHAG